MYITPDGRLFMCSQDRAYKGPDVVRFLRHLLRHIAGKLLVIWDGSPIHRAQPVKDFLAHGAATRLHLEGGVSTTGLGVGVDGTMMAVGGFGTGPGAAPRRIT